MTAKAKAKPSAIKTPAAAAAFLKAEGFAPGRDSTRGMESERRARIKLACRILADAGVK